MFEVVENVSGVIDEVAVYIVLLDVVYAFKVSFYILVYLTHHETKFGTFRFF
jgi:hypothetical protein